MTTLAEIRAKLVAQETRTDKSGDNAVFPFWNAPDNQSSVIRFLPDGDPENVYFWVERLTIRLPFQGTKNGSDREVFVQVPCMEMFGETCPILAETRPWWKDSSLENVARRYRQQKYYLFNGFVVSSAIEEKDIPGNPIRRFLINKGIFEIIKSSLMNPEMEDLPIDYVSGRDFKLTKTKQGDFANYSTSNWSFKTRSLTPDEQQAVKTHNLFMLKEFLPKKPNVEELQIIKEMFQASVNDEAYDSDKWGSYFKPFGSNQSGDVKPAVVVKMTGNVTNNFSKNFTKADDEYEEIAPDPAKIESSPATGLDVMARLQSRTAGKTKPEEKEPKQDPMDIIRRIKEKQGLAQ